MQLHATTVIKLFAKQQFGFCCVVGIELCIGVWKHDYTKINYSFLLGDGSKRIRIWQMTHRSKYK